MNILVIALILGFFLVIQSRSFSNVSELGARDVRSNAFQEIQILKEKNEDLKKEIEELEDNLIQLSDQNKALESIEAEAEKYKKLSGGARIFGPGVEVTINKEISTVWMIDIINELFNSGAEALSVNGIRIVNSTAGFDTLPLGQTLLNGTILSAPYKFEAIGEPSTLIHVLEVPGGILSRVEKAFPQSVETIVARDVISM